ncbi:BREX system ATP-binding protein BrxD [Actinomadura madurae]|uniref:BREX system ATP-binding protein BrxD n=1 Tax=Actinomadura madurae TaxID=1993 RepID=UPI000D831473|nr:BREX system ATP-binding protein BrxD [Actinomadura madurae]SPT57627.1 P-loop Domain of uncharacterised function (DUF2791) [Actinomadura madurae]
MLAPGGAVVVPWDTRIRYTARKGGYHGGVSLAEMVVPIVVLLPSERFVPDGWETYTLAMHEPVWWTPFTAPRQTEAPKPARKRAEEPLFDVPASGALPKQGGRRRRPSPRLRAVRRPARTVRPPVRRGRRPHHADGQPDLAALAAGVDELMEQRLADVARTTPLFASALRGYRKARLAGDHAAAEALLAWVGGQPNVGASAKHAAGIKGQLDHFGALGFLQGLLTVLRDCGHPGLLVVLDEIETLQRVRSDVREKALNALRQLIDEVDGGRFPGLFLVITGTPAFFDGQQGARRLPPLAQRLATDFSTDPRFDSPRAVQLRLTGFDLPKLVELGATVRDLFAMGARHPERVASLVDDAYLSELAKAVTGGLGGQVGVAPRVFLRKLVADVLDRVDYLDGFDPRRDYRLTLSSSELSEVERNAAASTLRAGSADEVELDL